MTSAVTTEEPLWYVLRDLKRSNAKLPAYKQLLEEQLEVFTPMRWVLTVRQGRRVREERPFVPDLLFVRSTRSQLDPFVRKIPTLQYRYLRGGRYCDPMTVPEIDMHRFIHALRSSSSPRYYLPEEVTPSMYGRYIRIVGGPLDGYAGHLLTSRGSRVKRLLVSLPGLLSVSVEVNPEYIQIVQ